MWHGPMTAEVFEQSTTPEPNTGCWLWTGAVDSDGCGKVGISRRTVRAPRAAWGFYVGQIPEGLLVCHRCGMPACVNPAHLFLGTHAERAAARRAKRGTLAGAARAVKHRLGAEAVERIRELYRHVPAFRLAFLFGVSVGTVRNIATGRTRGAV